MKSISNRRYVGCVVPVNHMKTAPDQEIALDMYPPQPRVLSAGDAYFAPVALSAPAASDALHPPVLVCENVHKTYLLGVEGVPALRGVSLSIAAGEFVCIFGTSGGGKTTLLNVLGTIDRPTRGHLTVCGVRVASSTPDSELARIRLEKLGFVFQTFNLLSSLTALENVEMPMILAGRLTAAERRKRAKELLTAVGMEKRFDHVPAQLSGGEQQRVTIARSIANSPDVLLLDEPTGDLDSVSTIRVMSLLTRLNKEQGITMVMVTHDIGLKYFADRILWMRDGKLNRVEVVSAAKRAEMYRNLDRDMRALTAATTASAANNSFQVNASSVPVDVDQPWLNTKVRKASHYEALRGIAAQQELMQQMQHQPLLKSNGAEGSNGDEEEVMDWTGKEKNEN